MTDATGGKLEHVLTCELTWWVFYSSQLQKETEQVSVSEIFSLFLRFLGSSHSAGLHRCADFFVESFYLKQVNSLCTD